MPLHQCYRLVSTVMNVKVTNSMIVHSQMYAFCWMLAHDREKTAYIASGRRLMSTQVWVEPAERFRPIKARIGRSC